VKVIMHTVDVAAPPQAVYAALTGEAGLAGWWTTRVRAAGTIGGHVEFTFQDGFNPAMEITDLEPDALVGWRCVGGVKEWTGDIFSFQIVPRNGASRLRMRQHYASELDDDTYGIFNFNWGYYLESLRLLCTTGKGKPYSPAS
jgi:uncharacterized protein YndB with AHSA1/START domain